MDSTSTRKCWICREKPADSGEHKYPATFLRRIPDSWTDLQHVRAGKELHTQSGNSNNFKIKVICRDCNNSRTAPQDRALDSFLKGVQENEEVIWWAKSLPLRAVVGDKHETVLDVYRCLMKMEFSRFCEDGLEIPRVVSEFVRGGNDWPAVNQIVRVQFRMIKNYHDRSIVYPSETSAMSFATGGECFISNQINFGWLGVHFVWALRSQGLIPWSEWSMRTTPLSCCEMIGNDGP